MKDHNHDDVCRGERGPCECLPEPVRMNYFHGQLISERDLKTEQAYFREKLRHAHRCLHGYGVICGMEVSPVPPPDDCLPDDSARRKELRARISRVEEELKALKEKYSEANDEDERKKLEEQKEELEAERERLRAELDGLSHERPDRAGGDCEEPAPLHLVRVGCGAAIDCDGRDVILARDRIVDVMGLLKPSERERLSTGNSHQVWLSVCYEECGREPTRPFELDDCATTNACQMARVAEGARITASLTRPDEDERCDPCCTCCDEPCILLAVLEVNIDEPISGDDIDHSVRRRFGLYDPTVITGISWEHGETYSAKTANTILGTKDEAGGIEIAFSRPVRVSTLQLGTVELMRITGGRGLSGVIAAMEGEFVDLPPNGMVDRVRYRDTTGETVQPRDRIMIIVRAPFLLDRCCRPVEGLHIGGKVPQLKTDTEIDEAARREKPKVTEADAGQKAAKYSKDESYEPQESDDPEDGCTQPAGKDCDRPPWGPMPWTTSGPGNFESWFWVAEE